MSTGMRPRVIPVLLVKGSGLVKGTCFSKDAYLGDPLNAIRIFNEKEVDELIVLDISASVEGRGPDIERVRDWAGECFMPICYGGGISSIAQMDALFSAGVEKVALNTASTNANLLREAAARFGSQSLVAAIDVRSGWFGGHKAVVRRGTTAVAADPAAWALLLRNLGVGEILLQSVDRDGTMNGYDLELIRAVTAAVDVPVIALGGAGTISHLQAGLAAGAAAVAAGSMFVFHGRHRAVLITYPDAQALASLCP